MHEWATWASKGVFGSLGQLRNSHLIPPFLTFRCLVARLGRPQQCPPYTEKAPQPGRGEKLKSSFAPQPGWVCPATARARPPRPKPPLISLTHFLSHLLLSLPSLELLPSPTAPSSLPPDCTGCRPPPERSPWGTTSTRRQMPPWCAPKCRRDLDELHHNVGICMSSDVDPVAPRLPIHRTRDGAPGSWIQTRRTSRGGSSLRRRRGSASRRRFDEELDLLAARGGGGLMRSSTSWRRRVACGGGDVSSR
jgi:hypothetical protein